MIHFQGEDIHDEHLVLRCLFSVVSVIVVEMNNNNVTKMTI